MKVIRRKYIDWEPLVMEFVPKDYKENFNERLQEFIANWGKARDNAKSCQCTTFKLEVIPLGIDKKNVVKIGCEWVCDKCLKDLLNAINTAFSEIKEIRIGDDGSVPSRKGSFWVKIPENVIKMENGNEIHIPSFSISRYQITVGEFEQFVSATGYITDAEKQGKHTFRENDTLLLLNKKARLEAEAFCLSYNDAQAYCKWRRVRLPSEEEYMSAYKMTSLEIAWYTNWTNTQTDDNKIVVSNPSYRWILTPDSSDYLLGFRIVKRENK